MFQKANKKVDNSFEQNKLQTKKTFEQNYEKVRQKDNHKKPRHKIVSIIL